jgi:hypothetical protein
VYDALGTYLRKVSTSSPLAQTYFDQGLRLTIGFGHETARTSFHEAVKHDSTCAMCWWGLAWALGPYINARMDSTSGVEAYAAVRRARQYATAASPVERALIDAMASRCEEVPMRLRAWCLYRRRLLGDVARVAAHTVTTAVCTLTREPELAVGIVACIQTHGSRANWHPHIHTIVTGIGIIGAWRPRSTVAPRKL